MHTVNRTVGSFREPSRFVCACRLGQREGPTVLFFGGVVMLKEILIVAGFIAAVLLGVFALTLATYGLVVALVGGGW